MSPHLGSSVREYMSLASQTRSLHSNSPGACCLMLHPSSPLLLSRCVWLFSSSNNLLAEAKQRRLWLGPPGLMAARPVPLGTVLTTASSSSGKVWDLHREAALAMQEGAPPRLELRPL